MNYQTANFILLAIFLTFTAKIESHEKQQKIYVSSSDLEISDQGLYLYDAQKGYVYIDAVFFDNNGLYIFDAKKRIEEEITDTCYNKHKIWCWTCLGCAIPWCKARCKCVEWPFGVLE